MNSRSRAVLRITLGLAQLGLATATVAAWLQRGVSRATITLAVLTAAALIVSLGVVPT